MPTTLQYDLRLPAHYRVADILAFHGRDCSALAEQLTPEGFAKGFMLDQLPVRVDVRFTRTLARCRITVDGDLPQASVPRLERAVRNMLALSLDPSGFVQRMAEDAHFGALVQARPGLRIVQTATVFEALTWAIIGQQINLTFAVSLRRTLIEQAGRRHASGLACYPAPADVAALALEQLTARKFSRSKADTLLRVARMAVSGELALDAGQPIDAVKEALLAIKGVGPWTVNYTLMRGFGYQDCSLHGDVAVRSAMQRLLQLDERPDIAAAERWLQSYEPHRALAAAHLWASLSNEQ
jgi:DNA-3-methyladenine glycosylase II